VAQYATTSDLQGGGLPAAALAGVSSAQQDAALLRAGDLIDSYIRGRATLPLASPYPGEIVRCNVIIAAYDLMQFRGYNPDEFDAGFRARYEDCLAWLRDLSAGRVNLAAAADATPAEREGRPRIATGAMRGW
jgi:phage gp36-like protein